MRRFRGDGRDVNNISVSIASCYGSDEVEEKKGSSALSGLGSPVESRLCFKRSECLSLGLSVSVSV